MPNRIVKTCCSIVIIFSALTACRSSQKTEMQRLAPSDAIIYLETNDVAVMLNSLTESQAFQTLAATKADFSAFEKMQLAVVVTGFESSEKQTGEDNFTLNFKPQFVAIIETHALFWQTRSLVENQLDAFVRKNYGDDAKREKSDKEGGVFFNWTASDNRRVFAFVERGLIYFGNDTTALEKCLAVKRGETDSFIKNDSFVRARSENNLAFGYVSSAGVAQIANLAGISLAVDTAEESDGRNFIARVLPQITKDTTKEILWTANKTERGIQDDYIVSLSAETVSALKETLATDSNPQTNAAEFLPPDFFSATRYNLKNPLTAWRNLLLAAAKNTDALSGKFLVRFSDRLLEPYEISNAGEFLSSIDSEIITAQFDADGEKSAAIVSVKDPAKIKSSIAKEINFNAKAEKQFGASVWFSEDKQSAAAFVEDKLILGDAESVLKCLRAKDGGQNYASNSNFQKFLQSSPTSVTFGRDTDSAEKIVRVLAAKRDEDRKLATFYSTETRFTEKGIERRTVSDFGLIGTILKQTLN